MLHDGTARRWSRRQFFAAGGSLTAGLVLAACGAASPATGTTAAVTTGATNSTSATNPVSQASTTSTAAGTETRSVPTAVQVYGPEDGPGVLLVHPWWGVSPGVLAWKDALVAAGARVVVPDLYNGVVTTDIAEAEALSNALEPAAVFEILDASADLLGGSGRDWSAVGWSLGAFYAAQMIGRGERAPQRAVLFYGAAPPRGDSRTEAVQLHIAPDDPYFTDQEITAAIDGFDKAGITVERYDYPGLRHWFAEVGSPAYDEPATALATERVLAFLGLPAG